MANYTDNKRLAINTVLLYVRMFIVLIIGLYTSRLVLKALGVADYGVYNVVAGFVSMFGFLNATLSASMQRFYNYQLGKNGEEGVSKVYSIGVRVHLIVAISVLILLETLGLWYVNNVMSVPDGRLFAANIIYQATILSLVLIILQIPYSGLVMAYERMGYYSIVTLLDTFLKLLIAIAITYTTYDHLIVYGILMFGISAINIFLYIVYVKKKLLSDLRLRAFDKKLAKDILSFSGWNLIGSFAFLTKDQGLNLLLNYFFGTIINAARGIAFQVKSAIGNFTHSITTSFRPQIVDAYAKNDFKRVKKLFFFESKICYSLILFLIIPIIFEIKKILYVWLGSEVPEMSYIFTVLVLADSLVCSINPAINHIVHAVGEIKNYQVANTIVNILLIPVSWVILKTGANAVSVFVATIIFSVFNQIVCLWQANKLLRFGLVQFLQIVVLPCVFATFLAMIPQLIVLKFVETSLLRFVMVCIIDVIFTLTAIAYIVLNKGERVYLIKMIKGFLKKQ